MGFTNAIKLASDNLAKENAQKLRDHECYNFDAKKLAGLMVKSLR